MPARPRESSTARSSAHSSRTTIPAPLPPCASSGSWLGQACASIGAVLDPQRFVFGGGVAAAGVCCSSRSVTPFLAHLPARGFHPEPTFSVAELVNDAGVVEPPTWPVCTPGVSRPPPLARLRTTSGGRVLYWFLKTFIIGPFANSVFRPWSRGEENVPESGAVIFASNHCRSSTPSFLPVAVRRPISFLARASTSPARASSAG